MNVIVQLEFELAYYDSVVNRFNNYITSTPPSDSSERLPIKTGVKKKPPIIMIIVINLDIAKKGKP